mgnify:CR=1 FL=1
MKVFPCLLQKMMQWIIVDLLFFTTNIELEDSKDMDLVSLDIQNLKNNKYYVIFLVLSVLIIFFLVNCTMKLNT